MGLPQQPNPDTSSPSHPPTSTTTTSPPKDPSTLPPEALDLATKLFDFARQGLTQQLNQYITAGIPANLTNHKGDTLLMLAAYHGHVETVKMLLEAGADVDALNERGQSPIAGAVFKGFEEAGGVVEVLVKAGADLRTGQPNAVDSARMFRREGCLRLFGVEE
ncbi:hypothetical protein LTR78_000280 [Recurvomyces mirabilis]|uniref:Ankyrin n=1 Tax=Recurvomyces mirabilis TaxID=574656 RepID=A0AAE0WXP7_9PEZI|nr:hypothetical protein LTR78_000280 [Recurvomyces mirabilis]KAK5161935.1 hypothetical protein LTS14_000281 [Recurvomyces mirabilis]